MRSLDTDLPVKLNTLRSNLYFDDLPRELLTEIAGHMQLREFERGETLF